MIAWVKGDELPDGWTLDSGAVAAVVDGEIRLGRPFASVGAYRRLVPAEGVPDLMVIQAEVAVEPSSGDLPSHHGLALSDGRRSVALLTGEGGLILVRPDSGDTLAVVRSAVEWAPEVRHHLRLERASVGEWRVYVDSELVLRLPYDRAPAVAERAGWAWGLLDSSALGFARWSNIEASEGLDVALPAEVERAWLRLPLVVQQRAGAGAAALVRSIAGAFAGSFGSLRDLWVEATLGDGVVYDRVFSRGHVDPDAQVPGWAWAGTQHDVLGDQWRWIADPSVYAERSWASIAIPPSTRAIVAATWRRLDAVAPTGNDTGAVLILELAGRLIVARSRADDTTNARPRWVLVDGEGAGASDLGAGWPVVDAESHRVELVAIAFRAALLVVDGRVVARVPWADLPAAGGRRARVQVDGGVWVLEDVGAELRALPQGHARPWADRLLERLFATSGCERTDEVDVWSRRRWSAYEARGTTRGIEQEILRLSCGDAGLLVEDDAGRWELDRTWPEVSPVILDEAEPGLVRVNAEIGADVRLTDAQLAGYLTSYHLPISVAELRYLVWRRHLLTAASTAEGGDDTRIEVASVQGLEVGQIVELRTAAGDVVASTEILEVDEPELVIRGQDHTWAAGDVLRRKIGES